MDEVHTCICGGQAFSIHEEFIRCVKCRKEWKHGIIRFAEKSFKTSLSWKSRLKGLKFRGLFFQWGIPPDEPVTFMFPKWKTGWLRTQMNEFLFLGYCYLSWSM